MGHYLQCTVCGKYVNAAKPFLGSLHLCLSSEERAARNALQIQLNTQNQFLKNLKSAGQPFKKGK